MVVVRGGSKQNDQRDKTYILRLEVVEVRASENAVPELPRIVSVTLLSKVAGELWLGDPVERPKGRRVALALGELGRPLGLDDRHALLERALVRLGRLGRSTEAR